MHLSANDGLNIDVLAKLKELEKEQISRAANVFVSGPGMIYAGVGRKMPDFLRALTIVVGIGTIFHNLNNYLEIEKLKRNLKIQE